MRKTLCLLVTLLSVGAIAQTAASQSPATTKSLAPAVLADGTPVKLRVGAGINTATLHMGDEVELEVAEEIRIDDVAVIPAGSMAKVVVMSQSVDSAKTGKSFVTLRFVTLADGEQVGLRPTRQRKAGASDSLMVAGGEGDLSISNGAEITAYTNGSLSLDLPKLRLASQPTNELKILTIPGNAEVSVDGKVMGSTPFAGQVTRGEHVVTIRMAGFQAWRGTVRVSATPAALQIALKKEDGMESVAQPVAAAPSLGDLAKAARAKKAAENGPKAQGEPLELLPGETRPATPEPNPPQSPNIPSPATASNSASSNSTPSTAAPSTAASSAAAPSASTPSASTPAASATSTSAPSTSTPATPSDSSSAPAANSPAAPPANSPAAPAAGSSSSTAPASTSNSSQTPQPSSSQPPAPRN